MQWWPVRIVSRVVRRECAQKMGESTKTLRILYERFSLSFETDTRQRHKSSFSFLEDFARA